MEAGVEPNADAAAPRTSLAGGIAFGPLTQQQQGERQKWAAPHYKALKDQLENKRKEFEDNRNKIVVPAIVRPSQRRPPKGAAAKEQATQMSPITVEQLVVCRPTIVRTQDLKSACKLFKPQDQGAARVAL